MTQTYQIYDADAIKKQFFIKTYDQKLLDTYLESIVLSYYDNFSHYFIWLTSTTCPSKSSSKCVYFKER